MRRLDLTHRQCPGGFGRAFGIAFWLQKRHHEAHVVVASKVSQEISVKELRDLVDGSQNAHFWNVNRVPNLAREVSFVHLCQ